MDCLCPQLQLQKIVLFAIGAVAIACGCSSDSQQAADAQAQIADASIADAPMFDAAPDASSPDASVFPTTLAETGLYADVASEILAPGVLGYSPAWPLWSDAAVKRRWILLPGGRTIDTSDMDFWVLPEGTKLWKDFTLGGQRIETRFFVEDGKIGRAVV